MARREFGGASGKSVRLGIGIALVVGLIAGAAGGFVVGRRAQRPASGAGTPRPGPIPPNISTGGKAVQQGERTAAARGKASVIGDLGGLPPGEAWRLLLEMDDQSARAEAVRALLDSMPPAQWPIWLAGMIDTFKDEDIDDHDPEQMAKVFGTLNTVLQHMVATHPAECIKAMLEVDKEHGHGDDLLEAAMKTWARRDVEAARRFYESEIAGRTDSSGRARHKADEIARSLVSEMARRDPQGTLQWAANQTDKNIRERAITSAFEAILKSDRGQAMSLLETRTDLPNRNRLAERVASDWAKEEPAKAFEWANTLSDDLRAAAAKSAFETWLKRDSDGARAAFDALAPAERGPLLRSVVTNAPREQMGVVAELLAREPVSPGRAEASQALIQQWVGHDPTAATQWLAQQPAGEVADRAIVGFLSWADGYEPQAALEWAGTISDPKLKSQHLEGLVKRYRSPDPEMARAWVSSTNRLTPAERARCLQLISAAAQDE